MFGELLTQVLSSVGSGFFARLFQLSFKYYVVQCVLQQMTRAFARMPMHILWIAFRPTLVIFMGSSSSQETDTDSNQQDTVRWG